MIESEDVHNYIFKIIVIGDSNVGKTCLLKCYSNRIFSDNYTCTIGVDLLTKSVVINENLIKLQLWDTAGMEKYKHITRSYYRGAHAAIICFDLTNKNSFNSLTRWMKEYSSYHNTNNIYVIVGNKSDLIDERDVSNEDIIEFVERNKCIYFQTSAKNGDNVDSLFNDLSKIIYERFENEGYQKTGEKLMSVGTFENLNERKWNKNCSC